MKRVSFALLISWGLIATIIVPTMLISFSIGFDHMADAIKNKNYGYMRDIALVFFGFPLSLLGLSLAARRSDAIWQGADTSEDKLLLDCYRMSAKILEEKNENMVSRISAISMLEKLAQEHPEKYHVEVIRLLCVFIQQSRLQKGNNDNNGGPEGENVAELQHCCRSAEAAAQAVGRCRARLANRRLAAIEKGHKFLVDLRKAYLAHAFLGDANFSGAYLEGVTLSGAILDNANLTKADFSEAILHSTKFRRARLERARFKSAIGLKREMLDQAKRSAPPCLPKGLCWRRHRILSRIGICSNIFVQYFKKQLKSLFRVVRSAMLSASKDRKRGKNDK